MITGPRHAQKLPHDEIEVLVHEFPVTRPAVRQKVTQLEHVMRGSDPEDKQETRDETETATAPTLSTVPEPATSTATAQQRETDESALWEDAWDEWDDDAGSHGGGGRSQQQINSEGSQRVRDMLAARRSQTSQDDTSDASWRQGPQMN